MNAFSKGNNALSYIIVGLLTAVLCVQLVSLSLEKSVPDREDAYKSKVCEDHFFALTPDDRLFMMTPAQVSEQERFSFQTWLVEALVNSLSFAWFAPQSHIDSVSQYFTEDGLEKFKAYHLKILEELQVSQMMHYVSISGSPSLTKEISRVIGGSESHYTVPVIIMYQSGSRVQRFNAVVNVVVEKGYTGEGQVRRLIQDIEVTEVEKL